MSFMCASDSRITEKSLGSTSKGPRVASIGTTDKMDVEQPVIDDTLVRRMVAAQFPQWADLTVRSAVVGGTAVDSDGGPYGAEGFVRQAIAPLPQFNGNYVVLGSWIAAGEPCGLSVREDVSPITKNTSRFLPHAIID